MSDENPSGNPPGNGTSTAPWYASIENAELRGRAELSKFETPEKLLESYVNLEKHMGAPADRLLRLPEKPEDPAWKDIHKRLGFDAPDDPKDYELPVPEGFNTDYAAAVAAKAKELGIPKHMLKGLAEFNNEYMVKAIDADTQAAEAAATAKHATAMAELRVAWGGTFDTTMALAQRAEAAMKAELGVGEESLLAWQNADPQAYYKMLAYQGSRLAEGERIDGGTTPSTATMSPEAAKVKIAALSADPDWFARWHAGGVAERAEWSRLHTILRSAQAG